MDSEARGNMFWNYLESSGIIGKQLSALYHSCSFAEKFGRDEGILTGGLFETTDPPTIKRLLNAILKTNPSASRVKAAQILINYYYKFISELEASAKPTLPETQNDAAVSTSPAKKLIEQTAFIDKLNISAECVPKSFSYSDRHFEAQSWAEVYTGVLRRLYEDFPNLVASFCGEYPCADTAPILTDTDGSASQERAVEVTYGLFADQALSAEKMIDNLNYLFNKLRLEPEFLSVTYLTADAPAPTVKKHSQTNAHSGESIRDDFKIWLCKKWRLSPESAEGTINIILNLDKIAAELETERPALFESDIAEVNKTFELISEKLANSESPIRMERIKNAVKKYKNFLKK